ncbi:carboxylesterase/lipase family protein [Glycocaulis abyssi]|uniref:Carboxylic ester hydrolase n=1 Tax=Glycocaulis abyssi TaxID=1433403 RepID=A0ABV9NHN9_9PROT
MTGRILLALAGAVSLSLPAIACARTPAQVDTPAGTLQGTSEAGITVFRGIPYAEAPTGERRWQAPVPATDWEGVRDATAFGPVCHQPPSRPGSIYAEERAEMSEDCLSLNVWAPENAENAPVFVWIHGGSLIGGAGSDSMYDGARLAAEGLVVVTINYRVGILGFLAHPELSAESPDNISGNYGLLDQIEALRWVNRNIAAFGGDPANVTIAGESAGALSVMYLMGAPAAHGLFARAIAQSGYMVSAHTLRGNPHGVPSAEEMGVWLAGQTGHENLAALRAADPQDLTMASAMTGYFPFPAIDGHVLPDQLVDQFDRGEQAQVPILAGFNEGEIRSLRFLLPEAPETGETYTAEIEARYGELAPAFLELYPAGDLEESLLAITRDAMYGWTAMRLVRSQNAAGHASYLYYFNHSYPAADEMDLHAFHAAEIPYAFGTLDRTPPYWPAIPETARETALSDAMVGYWVSFARDGVPVAEGFPAWSAYGDTQAYMEFAGEPRPGAGLMPGMFELHEDVVCRRRAAGIAWNWNIGIISPPLPAGAPECR